MSERKYLLAEEEAIEAAKKAYRKALEALQDACEHRVVLEHIGTNHEMFRVCEDCGTTCRAPWSSPVHAYGNMEIFSQRAYRVDWVGFATATPRAGVGWCQTRDNPKVFRRGGPKHG